MSDQTLFIVQPYRAMPHRLIALAAQVYADETSARRAGNRLARFRTGVVVLSQAVDVEAARRSVPATLAIHGQVPEEWLDRLPLGLKRPDREFRHAA
ncbi:hypothetical protein [Lichenihabitans psoromatis]|uniref:hypothetical protein n=1 Tax=Lichenihabitans psoromatis TaxID=2528642 RepID=UPI001035AA68|nr:hypothetical protein [Lichenihabitans psoromatis]